MNIGIQDAMVLAGTLATTLSSVNEESLQAYDAMVAFTDRLTRLATVSYGLRPLRNILLKLLVRASPFRRRLAWHLSGLVYR
jgi:2-polyprenyl-6-methoxyphenol hydroxylase-like FAD-dependent oxidoreductase